MVATTKFHTPTINHQTVNRTAVLTALTASAGRRLTLLSAPAGWGKTTALAQFLGQHDNGVRHAWLSLDSADNDPMVFWSYLIAALQHVDAALAPRASELRDRGADLDAVVLPALVNELHMVEDRFALVLDDYHHISSPIINAQMTFLVERLPASVQLILATRSDPSLPLARLRTGRDLHELRTGDLRLNEAETASLLNGVCELGLRSDQITMLHRRTEGWAAGLYMVAMSLMGRPDRDAFIADLAGDNRHVFDYLSAEVLDRESPEIRTFLVRTSVLSRLSGELCDAVLESTGSAPVLQRIESDNLFLEPLDLSRRWYRYHQLFAELLGTELRRTEPLLAPELHRRAAEWLERDGSFDDAVRHLAAAGDTMKAADLIASTWASEFNQGRLSTVSGWLDSLPAATSSADPRLAVARAWIAMDSGHTADAEAWIQAAERCLTTRADAESAWHDELVVLRAVGRFKLGDIAETLTLAHRAVGLNLSPSYPGLPAAYCIYGSALYWSGHTADAQAAYHRAIRLSEELHNPNARAYALGYLAMIAVRHDLLAEAEQLIRRIGGDERTIADEGHFVDMMGSLASAMLLDRRGQSAAATEAARMAVLLALPGGGIIEQAHALLIQSEVLGHVHDTVGSRASAERAADVIATAVDPSGVRRRLSEAALEGPFRAADRDRKRRRDEPLPDQRLTTTEVHVLRLLATPLSREEIGAHLTVSVNTVKSHQRALYRKLAVTSRADAVNRARQLGLL